jgi:hypothetical protein
MTEKWRRSKKTREKEYYEIAWKCHIWNERTYVEQKKEKLRVSEWIVPGLWEIFSQKRWQTQNSFPFKLSHWVFLSFGNDFNGKMTFFEFQSILIFYFCFCFLFDLPLIFCRVWKRVQIQKYQIAAKNKKFK